MLKHTLPSEQTTLQSSPLPKMSAGQDRQDSIDESRTGPQENDTTASTQTPTFGRFKLLPPELRHEIWGLALLTDSRIYIPYANHLNRKHFSSLPTSYTAVDIGMQGSFLCRSRKKEKSTRVAIRRDDNYLCLCRWRARSVIHRSAVGCSG